MEHPTISVLLISNDTEVFHWLEAMFSMMNASEGLSANLDLASDKKMIKKAVKENNRDIYLVDLFAEEIAPNEILKEIRNNRLDGASLALAGREDHSAVSEAMKSGAINYLVREQLTPGMLSHAIRSVHDNYRIRKDLESSRELYSALFDASMDAVLVVDDDKVLDANREAINLFGWDEEEIIEKNYHDLIPPNDGDALREAMSAAGLGDSRFKVVA